MNVETIKLITELDEATHLFNQARQEQQWATAVLCLELMRQHCRQIVLENTRLEQEKAWGKLPNLKPISPALISKEELEDKLHG